MKQKILVFAAVLALFVVGAGFAQTGSAETWNSRPTVRQWG